MAFNPNENYNGLTKLKEFWPIVKENFQKVKDEFAENSFTEEYEVLNLMELLTMH